jgi:hypothetical protein
VPPFVTLVGLFVNETKLTVRRVMEAVPIQLLQFHGDEAPESFCRSFHAPYPMRAAISVPTAASSSPRRWHALDELRRPTPPPKADPAFQAEFRYELKHYVGRPSPVYHAKRWSELLGGAQIYLKREDLNHTGAHKINNTIGQALLARRMGKPRVIAETGAGQHGVATATVAARYGMECVVYMGSRTSSARRRTSTA